MMILVDGIDKRNIYIYFFLEEGQIFRVFFISSQSDDFWNMYFYSFDY